MTEAIARARRSSSLPVLLVFLALSNGVATAQPYDINAMGRECTKKIGVIKPFSCLDGEIIPITVNNRVIVPGDPEPGVCDRPSLLAPAFCKPFSRVGRLEGLGPDGKPDTDVQINFICRRYNHVTDPNNPSFKDVAIIQHRKSTGDTCFFQHLDDYLDATRVPPPSETVAETPAGRVTAEKFWMSPERTARVGCNSCHDAGPFIHSPYIGQVRLRTDPSKTIVHPFPNLGNAEPNNYRFVGAPFQYWGTPEFIKPENNKCTECHVLGVQMSSDNYTSHSVGRSYPNSITEMYKQYPRSHWMPPAQAEEMTQQIFERLYGYSIDQILACGARGTMQSPPECKRQPFGPAN